MPASIGKRSRPAPGGKIAAALLLALASCGPAAAQDRPSWRLELSLGADYAFGTTLSVKQHGYEDIEFGADYDTRPFESPFYYSVRASRWTGGRSWELEIVHQKLYLENPPPEIQQFSISHGFNLFLVNRAWDLGTVVLRVGGGVVLAHPESTVRNLRYPQDGGLFDAGYHLTGPSIQAAVGKRLPLSEKWFLSLEGKVTASYARVPISEGSARLTNLAAHALVGLGYGF